MQYPNLNRQNLSTKVYASTNLMLSSYLSLFHLFISSAGWGVVTFAQCMVNRELELRGKLKEYLSSAWISIEQWVIVFGIVYAFLRLWFMIGHVQLSLLIMGGPLGHCHS